MPVLDVEGLKGACTQVFEGAGLGAEEARQIAHSLVLSNLMGHDSHGVIRLVQYVQALEEGRVHAGQEIAVVREADASAVVDGGWGFGQTVCHQAMALAMEKAKQRSVAVVELFNSGHIGRLGEYVEVTAEAEMIGIVMCNNHGGGLLQHPFGGIDARMSPNPIAVGIPTGGDFPIVVDLTTSVVAEGKIRVKRNLGESLPEGWVIDAEGDPTTEPAKFYGPPRGLFCLLAGFQLIRATRFLWWLMFCLAHSVAVVVAAKVGFLAAMGCLLWRWILGLLSGAINLVMRCNHLYNF